MKRLIILISFLITIPAFAGTATRHTTYSTGSEVTATNLNGNFDNVYNVVNGSLDNTNANTAGGYRFFEVLGALPSAGTEGRVVFLTTSDTINFDTGSAWNVAISVTSPTQGDILYYNGTAWTKLGGGTIGQVLTAQGATSNPVWEEASPTIVQVVNLMDGTVASDNAGTPAWDGSVPTSAEGNEFMSLAITPTDVSNELKIDVVFLGSSSGNSGYTVFLTQDAGNAIAAGVSEDSENNDWTTVAFTYYMTAGTTSATTFKVFGGTNGGATLTFNGISAASKLGGVEASSITITEIIP